MVVDTKVINLTTCVMEVVNFSIRKVAFMMVNGRIIICMEKGNYTILAKN